MVIKQVKKTKLYDIFMGTGWKNHSRVLVHDGHIHYKAGRSLSKIQNVEIIKTVGDK